MFLDIEDDLFESALQQEQQQLTRADSNGGHAQQDLNSINNAQVWYAWARYVAVQTDFTSTYMFCIASFVDGRVLL